MNAGKAVAQGAHAANQMVHYIGLPHVQPAPWREWLDAWQCQTRHGFGTTITLGCTEAQMRRAVEVAQTLKLPAGITHDPTYPLLDGPTLHLIPLDTCGFILGPKIWCKAAVSGLNLMP